MSLNGALGVAASGLDSITRQLAVTSQNIANAGNTGYVRESLTVTAATDGSNGIGVRSGPATRALDQALQVQTVAASATLAGQQVQSDALAGIDAASGQPGSGTDLPGLLGKLRDSFSTLANDPANQAQQAQVLVQAGALIQGLNGVGQAVSTARQAAQDGIAADVGTANAALHSLGVLSDQVIAAQARGDSTASLEDARDAQIRVVADLTGASFLRQSNGDLLAVAGGVLLPLRASSGPLAVQAATLGPDTPAAAVPAVTVAGANVTNALGGGRIGANLALRDTTLPAIQAGLDTFASSLASGFSASGLTLFTNPGGAAPTPPAAGFAQTIQVSAAVRAAPSMLRDGAGAAGPAGGTALIDGVLDGVLGSSGGSLQSQAVSLTSGVAQQAAAAAAELDTGKAVQTSLQAKLTAGSGVSVDSELSSLVQLQAAYGANAKVVAATETLWTTLLDSVR